MYKDEYRPNNRIDSEGRNWARWCLTDGADPRPKEPGQASWVKYLKPDNTNRDSDKEPPPPPPIEHKSARRMQEVFKSLPQVCRHVMTSYWVGNYIYGKPRPIQETVDLLNQLIAADRLDVPEGYKFRRYHYEMDMKHIASKMEVALEIR